jgi:hypothetical protein
LESRYATPVYRDAKSHILNFIRRGANDTTDNPNPGLTPNSFPAEPGGGVPGEDRKFLYINYFSILQININRHVLSITI